MRDNAAALERELVAQALATLEQLAPAHPLIAVFRAALATPPPRAQVSATVSVDENHGAVTGTHVAGDSVAGHKLVGPTIPSASSARDLYAAAQQVINIYNIPGTPPPVPPPTAAPHPPADATPVSQAASGIDALRELLLRDPAIRAAGATFRSDFTTARDQVADVFALKDIHDLLHTLQFQCYIPLTHAAPRFPNDDTASEHIADYTLTLRLRTAEIQAVLARAPEVLGESSWVADLSGAANTLKAALDQRDPQRMKEAIERISRVLAVEPSHINTNLTARARGLRLRAVVAAMQVLRTQVGANHADQDRIVRFVAGGDALMELWHTIEARIADHDAWQVIDREVRRIAVSLRYDTRELEEFWPDLHARLHPLAAGAGQAEWAQLLQAELARLDAALTDAAGARPGAIFQRCSRIIGERFFQVDVDLKRQCSQLRELSDPLTELERMLT